MEEDIRKLYNLQESTNNMVKGMIAAASLGALVWGAMFTRDALNNSSKQQYDAVDESF